MNLLEGKEDHSPINPQTSLTTRDVPAFTDLCDIKKAIPNGNKADTNDESSDDDSSQDTPPLGILSAHNDSDLSDDDNEANKATYPMRFRPHESLQNCCS